MGSPTDAAKSNRPPGDDWGSRDCVVVRQRFSVEAALDVRPSSIQLIHLSFLCVKPFGRLLGLTSSFLFFKGSFDCACSLVAAGRLGARGLGSEHVVLTRSRDLDPIALLAIRRVGRIMVGNFLGRVKPSPLRLARQFDLIRFDMGSRDNSTNRRLSRYLIY